MPKSRRSLTSASCVHRWVAVCVALSLAVASFQSCPAQAIDRDVKAVMVVSAYGLVGGTVLGLAALPFNQDVRTVFIGSSLGLYLGIAVGLYYVYDRYDQNNPLRMKPGDRQNGAREDGTVDRELRGLASARAPGSFEAGPGAREPLRVSVPVLNFY